MTITNGMLCFGALCVFFLFYMAAKKRHDDQRERHRQQDLMNQRNKNP